MKERIHGFITKKGGGVSFVEIVNMFGEGDHELSAGRNIILWRGLTSETSNAILELLKEKRIMMYPTHPMLYLIDGAGVTLPVAKRPPENGYKNPHWIPVVFWTIEQIKVGMKGGYLLTDPKKAAIYREGGYDI